MSPGSSVHGLGRAEAGKDLQRQAALERQVALLTDAPSPPAAALQQENIIRIEMRADAASRRGVAHHEIVEARSKE